MENNIDVDIWNKKFGQQPMFLTVLFVAVLIIFHFCQGNKEIQWD